MKMLLDRIFNSDTRLSKNVYAWVSCAWDIGEKNNKKSQKSFLLTEAAD